jgi:hypothetical protein
MPWIPRAASAYIHTSSSAFSVFARPEIHLPSKRDEYRVRERERNAGRTLHASLGDRRFALHTRGMPLAAARPLYLDPHRGAPELDADVGLGSDGAAVAVAV